MKINWGTGVVIAFVCFISFILFFVIRMNMDDKANHDLVTEEYYQEEIGYQKEIDAVKNANHNSKKISLQKTAEGLEISFPENLNNKEIKGTVSLYRPSNKHLDFDFPISLSDSHLLVPDKRLLEGRWDIKISWKYQNEEYLHKEKITY
ncbi:FixH family protein [Cellulophaga baltica]|uniref:FixH protein n=1 Tax=Cellulophaga baltica TaxID=76594 RepID=A0A1G7D3B4_9FLAO|nr:FixH family protein [Cellulophaga baltica]MBA6313465.1 FixH family protein [Cellulophaga baltica]MCR1023563.1 FixH family protein [Cellulophaga baltica]SDE46058.1 FixH protein [Cellulophaga baltica]